MTCTEPSTHTAGAEAPGGSEWISPSAVAELLARLHGEGAESDADRTLRLLLEDLLAKGASGTWATPDVARVRALRDEFPHFAEVVELFEGEAALATSPGARPQRIPPVLLLGEPGVGKTSFALALADALGAPARCHAMSTATAGFTLAGLDRGWSSGRPGLVFDTLRRGAVLNPMFLLDEIDKAPPEARSSPLGPLYQLLEPTTAREFVDEFVGLPIDASGVTWLATANDEGAIPPAICSRLGVFIVGAPDAGQMAGIVQRQFERLRSAVPRVHPRLPEEVMSALVRCTPRDAQRLLRGAVARAAVRASHAGRATISVSRLDLPAAVHPVRRVGFL